MKAKILFCLLALLFATNCQLSSQTPIQLEKIMADELKNDVEKPNSWFNPNDIKKYQPQNLPNKSKTPVVNTAVVRF